LNKKEQLITYLLSNNGKPEGVTWLQVADIFGIKTSDTDDAKRAKAANDLWRGYLKRKDKDSPDEKFLPTNVKVKKIWGKPGQFQYSYEAIEEDVDETRAKLIEDMSKFSPNVTKYQRKESKKIRIAYEIALPDFHIGRASISEERHLFQSCVSDLIGRVSNYDLDRIILPIGNDFFNTDNIQYTTTKGTQQFDKSTWQESFRAGWQMLVEAITYLSTLAPVYVIHVAGNHDKQRSFYLADIIYSWFRNDDNVIVNNSNESFKFHQYGQSLIMYDHGEIKKADYPLIMATEQPILFSESKYKEVHTGHFHKEMLDEFRGIKVRFLPSIAVSSQWEKESGYKHQRCTQGLKWHSVSGLIGIEQINYE